VHWLVSLSITINMIMGCGFLALPAAFASAGLAISIVALVAGTGLMIVTSSFEAEVRRDSILVCLLSQSRGSIA
jgi:amino acid permease